MSHGSGSWAGADHTAFVNSVKKTNKREVFSEGFETEDRVIGQASLDEHWETIAP